MQGSARSSPRAWGCFLRHLQISVSGLVFPTCVGVFPVVAHPLKGRDGLPHVRGGVSSGDVADTPAD